MGRDEAARAADLLRNGPALLDAWLAGIPMTGDRNDRASLGRAAAGPLRVMISQ